MPLVVDNVVRYTVHGILDGRAVDNIVDVMIAGGTSTRAAAIEAEGELIIDAWVNRILPRMVNDYQAQELRFVDLDSEDGQVGTLTSGRVLGFPASGTLATDPMPSNVAVLVTKNLALAGRGRRKGRMFLGAVTETATDTTNGNRLTASTAALYETAVDNFFDDVNHGVLTPPDDFGADLVVTHVTSRDGEGNPLTGAGLVVGSLSVSSTLATQRRRMRG